MIRTSLLIDIFPVFYQSFFGLPELTDSRGQSSTIVYGTARKLLGWIKQYRPTGIYIAWDHRSPVRRQILPAYKGTRTEQKPDFYRQIQQVPEMLAAWGLPVFEVPDCEADDVLAGLVQAIPVVQPLTVLTVDYDLLQLVSPRVTVVTPNKIVRPDNFEAHFGLQAEQWLDYKVLTGDASDNIPGVPGFGKLTATRKLVQHGSLTAYQSWLSVAAKLDRADREMLNHPGRLLRNRELMRLRPPQLPVPQPPAKLFDFPAALAYCESRGLGSLVAPLYDAAALSGSR
ncbi:MAG: hypothetical protein IPO08_22700 [Xanthomonadales bacterium]|nr:hypothetical protein [Xanthomonadales bacterium]